MSNSPVRRSRRSPPSSETAISRRSVASLRSVTPAYTPIDVMLQKVNAGIRPRAAQLGTRLLNAAPPRVRDSYALRRAGRRLLRRGGPSVVPERPIGAKLELTYYCTLRCSFCYTDSPRRTLEGSLEMGDEDWRRVVEQTI